MPIGCETCSGAIDGTGTVVDNDADNDGVCNADEIIGCQDSNACNYNAAATDAGSCILPIGCETCSGAIDGTGVVVDNDADNDGVCDADEIAGCQDPLACNYDPLATDDDGLCKVFDECGVCGGTGTLGCIDPAADNYDVDADCDDGSCITAGCTYSFALNYNALATYDDGSCQERIYGCTDPTALNHDVLANTDDSSCEYEVLGCTDCSADNYDPLATNDDGTCMITAGGCPGDFTGDGFVNVSDLGGFLGAFGSVCE